MKHTAFNTFSNTRDLCSYNPSQYHDSLLADQRGITSMYLTLKENFYANNVIQLH